MGITRQQLCSALSESGLMPESALEEFEAGLPEARRSGSGDQLARELVRECKLTEYQLKVLCKQTPDPLVIGDYLILEKIGEGGMGVVYKARHHQQRNLVALKLLPPKLSRDPEATRRFEREVGLAAKLKHPNIVEAMGSGTTDSGLYFVMEYVDGQNVAALVRDHPRLSLLTAFDHIFDAAQGLQYAHENGVVHRDIKPANLLVGRDGTTKILDMGLARTMSSADRGDSATVTDLTLSGTVLGTADYMAPEQALNAKHADHRSDIYSLGCTMHFVFVGQPIYEGETMMEKLVAHREQPVPSLCEARDDVPSAVDRIFQRMVAKSPDDRYGSIAEVVGEMRKCREEFGHMWMIRRFISEKKGKRL